MGLWPPPLAVACGFDFQPHSDRVQFAIKRRDAEAGSAVRVAIIGLTALGLYAIVLNSCR
jgi:hypothetical protein